MKQIILAVTGHRYIDANDKDLVKAVRKECSKFKALYPDAEYTILTGLAEGADRLVAKVAVKTLNARLIPVLAVPEESLMMDFETAASKREFRGLMKQASQVITAPLLSKEAWREYTHSRNLQYAWMGAFIASHADIMFALWDGKPAKGIGGTADVVRWFKDGKVPKKYEKDSDKMAKEAGVFSEHDSKIKSLIHLPA